MTTYSHSLSSQSVFQHEKVGEISVKQYKVELGGANCVQMLIGFFLVHWPYVDTREHLYKGYATISGGISFKAVSALELVSCIADTLCALMLMKTTLCYLDTPSVIVQVCCYNSSWN